MSSGYSAPAWEAPRAAPEQDAASPHEQGRAIYNFRCYYCHGYSGDARTLAATYLNPPPRSFFSATPKELSRAAMLDAVKNGRQGTGMKSFRNTLSPHEMELVVDFIRKEFLENKAPNTRYHTTENGWSNHERYQAAYPFALGQLPLDTPSDKLTPAQRDGLKLFLSSCVSCHDRAKVMDEGAIWSPRAVSFPRGDYSHRAPKVDAVSEPSVYARHDVAPVLKNPSAREKEGEQLFQKNCAFCHGADGTGQNWIGSFLEPHPRNLTSSKEMAGMTRAQIRRAIQEGVPGTKMPAWRTVLSEPQIEALIAYISRVFYTLPQ